MLFITIISATIILILIASYQSKKQRERFLKRYREFLAAHEGEEFFCYTNRKEFVDVLEQQLIPKLGLKINIIKLEGKTPITDLNHEFVSYALYRLDNIVFPNVMKINNGVMMDISLHNEIYNAINNKKFSDIQALVEDALSELRDRPKHPQQSRLPRQ